MTTLLTILAQSSEVAPVGNPVGFRIFLMVLFFLIGLAVFAFWLWTIVDCAKHETPEGNTKLIWLLVIFLAGWLGALIYLFVRRPQRKAALGQ